MTLKFLMKPTELSSMCVAITVNSYVLCLFHYSLAIRTAKIIILGESSVGKTSLVNRYIILLYNYIATSGHA